MRVSVDAHSLLLPRVRNEPEDELECTDGRTVKREFSRDQPRGLTSITLTGMSSRRLFGGRPWRTEKVSPRYFRV